MIDSWFDWVVNQEGYGMIALYTDWIVCSLIVGASESERRPCLVFRHYNNDQGEVWKGHKLRRNDGSWTRAKFKGTSPSCLILKMKIRRVLWILAICLKYGPILVFSTESQNVYFWTKMGHLWSQNYIRDFWNHFHLNSSKKMLPIHAVSSIFDNPVYISDKNHCRK